MTDHPASDNRLNPVAGRAWSRSGLILGGLYVAASIASIATGWMQADSKAAVFFLQLPLVPAFWATAAFGELAWFGTVSWWVAYGVCIPVTAAALYGVCWLAGPGLGRSGRNVVIGLGLAVFLLLLYLTLVPR